MNAQVTRQSLIAAGVLKTDRPHFDPRCTAAGKRASQAAAIAARKRDNSTVRKAVQLLGGSK